MGFPRLPTGRRFLGQPALSSAGVAAAPALAAARVAQEQKELILAERQEEIQANTRKLRLDSQTAVLSAAAGVAAEFDADANPDVGAYEAKYQAAVAPILDSITEENVHTDVSNFAERLQLDRSRQLQARASRFGRDERVTVLKQNVNGLIQTFGQCSIGPTGDECRANALRDIQVNVGVEQGEGTLAGGVGDAILADAAEKSKIAYAQNFINTDPHGAVEAIEGNDPVLEGLDQGKRDTLGNRANRMMAKKDKEIRDANLQSEIVANEESVLRFQRRIDVATPLDREVIEDDLTVARDDESIEPRQWRSLNRALDQHLRNFEDSILVNKKIQARLNGDLSGWIDVNDTDTKNAWDSAWRSQYLPLLEASREGEVTIGDQTFTAEEVQATSAKAIGRMGMYPESMRGMMKDGLRTQNPQRVIEAATIAGMVGAPVQGKGLNKRAFDDTETMVMNMVLARMAGGLSAENAVANSFTLMAQSDTEREANEKIWQAEDYTTESRDHLDSELSSGFLAGLVGLSDGGAVPNRMQAEYAAHVRALFLAGGGEDFDAAKTTGLNDLLSRWSLTNTGTGGVATWQSNPPEAHYQVQGIPSATWMPQQLLEEVQSRPGFADVEEDRIRIGVTALNAFESRPKYALFVNDAEGTPMPVLDEDGVHLGWAPDFTTTPLFAALQQARVDAERSNVHHIEQARAEREYMAEHPEEFILFSLRTQADLMRMNPFKAEDILQRQSDIAEFMSTIQPFGAMGAGRFMPRDQPVPTFEELVGVGDDALLP